MFTKMTLAYAEYTIISGLGCYMIYFFQAYKMDPETPEFLTTLGVFGTFVSIVLGLFPFIVGESVDIIESVPSLVHSIALASGCSVIGVGLSLLSKYVQNRKHRLEADNSHYPDATINTLANLLNQILESQHSQAKNTSMLLKFMAENKYNWRIVICNIHYQ